MNPVQIFGLNAMVGFHRCLRSLRGDRKLTQVRVAELPGASPRVSTRLENGDAVPLFATVARIADILKVTLDELTGRKEPAAAARIRNPELHRLYGKADLLAHEDQKALLVVPDSLVQRSGTSRLTAE